MSGGGRGFDLKNYVDVATRVGRFYAEHPQGRIVTELVKWDDRGIVFKAEVYRDQDRPVEKPDATGWAHEVPGEGYVNKTSPVENCETSAIGRALANLGFPVKPGEERPSREEMAKTQRGRAQPKRSPADQAKEDVAYQLRTNIRLLAQVLGEDDVWNTLDETAQRGVGGAVDLADDPAAELFKLQKAHDWIEKLYHKHVLKEE